MDNYSTLTSQAAKLAPKTTQFNMVLDSGKIVPVGVNDGDTINLNDILQRAAEKEESEKKLFESIKICMCDSQGNLIDNDGERDPTAKSSGTKQTNEEDDWGVEGVDWFWEEEAEASGEKQHVGASVIRGMLGDWIATAIAIVTKLRWIATSCSGVRVCALYHLRSHPTLTMSGPRYTTSTATRSRVS